MVKQAKSKSYISVEDIFNATNGGFDIYRAYIGKVGRCMDRPWGRPESKPSWGIFPKSGVWFWKDHGPSEESGNAIQFVERYFNLKFNDALNKIAFDFGIGGKEINMNPVKITWEKPDIERDYMDINFSDKKFDKKHHEFWNISQVTEDHCRKYNTYAVKDLAINRRKVYIGKDEIVFAYYCPIEDAAKIYFPERDKSERFRNNVSWNYLWNYENIGECEHLIVQKSMKDLLVTTLIEPCTIATQAEAVKIFDEETVSRINKVSKSPWVWYGSDWDGVKKCKEITDTNKWKYINVEKKYLPDVNDVYSYVRMFNLEKPGTGLKALEDFMRHKKLLK